MSRQIVFLPASRVDHNPKTVLGRYGTMLQVRLEMAKGAPVGAPFTLTQKQRGNTRLLYSVGLGARPNRNDREGIDAGRVVVGRR